MSEQVMIDRELLERLCERKSAESIDDEYIARAELRKILNAPAQPVSAKPAGEVPEVVGYLCNGGTKLMHASDRKEAIWSAGRPLMTVAQHTRIVSALQARAVVMPDALGRAFITGESCDGVYRVVIKSETLKEMQSVHNWIARLNGKGGA